MLKAIRKRKGILPLEEAAIPKLNAILQPTSSKMGELGDVKTCHHCCYLDNVTSILKVKRLHANGLVKEDFEVAHFVAHQVSVDAQKVRRRSTRHKI